MSSTDPKLKTVLPGGSTSFGRSGRPRRRRIGRSSVRRRLRRFSTHQTAQAERRLAITVKDGKFSEALSASVRQGRIATITTAIRRAAERYAVKGGRVWPGGGYKARMLPISMDNCALPIKSQL